MGEQPLLRARAESGEYVPAHRLGDLQGESVGERHDVHRTRAQRWKRHHLEGEPIEQIGPERPVAGERRQIDVRRADHPHVELNGPPAADPLHLAVLDHPQHLLLHRGRRARDFVEQQGSAVRALEAAHVLPLRSGECARLVAEELRVE